VASAHAFVIGSDPVDSSTVTTVPAVVRIFFNADISPLSVAHVYNIQNGQFVEVQTLGSSIPPGKPREVDTQILSPSKQLQGGYLVRWTAVANDDGHTTYGTIGFDVGYSSTGLSGTPTLGPSSSNRLDDIRTFDFIGVLSVAWEWLSLVALMFWLGILLTERLILPKTGQDPLHLDRTRKQVLSLQVLCLCALLMGEVVTLVLRILHLSDILNNGTIDLNYVGPMLTMTLYGYLWMIRVALIGVALGLLWWTQNTTVRAQFIAPRSIAPSSSGTSSLHTVGAQFIAPSGTSTLQDEGVIHYAPTTTQRFTPVWLLLAGLIVLTVALSGNAVQIAPVPVSAAALNWLALIAQGIWFGGLAYLCYILLPSIERNRHSQLLTSFLRHFQPWLLAAVALLLLSSLFLVESTLSSPQLLLTDPYGRIMLVAGVLLLLLLIVTLYMLLIARPALTRQAMLLTVVDAELPARRLRQSLLELTERRTKQIIRFQTVLAAALLLCIALMSFYAPPIVFPNITYSDQTTTGQTAGITQTNSVDDLSVTLQLLPGRVGYVNTAIVSLTDANKNPVTDAQIHLTANMLVMDMGTSKATINGGNPTYIATFPKNAAFSMSGVWQITLTITRPGHGPVQTVFPITIPV
jgi:putative copper export protein/methionine-rich copper-binding protein CopC